MLRLPVDRLRIRATIAGLARESSALKQLLRARWERPMKEEQQHARRTKRLLTELHVLLAASRGRLHVTTPPRAIRDSGAAWDALAFATQLADRLAPDYPAPAQAGEPLAQGAQP